MGGPRRDQKKFNELVKDLKDKKFKYIHKEEEVIDWGKYDKAQIHEVNDMLLMIADYVDEATKRLGIVEITDKDPGRPTYPPDDVAKAVMMQQYFCYANRQSEGLVILFKEKMRIKTLFSYKTIERGYQDVFVTLIIHEVFKMTQEPISEKEHSFSADGTCLPTSIKQNWENDKQKYAKEKAQKEKEEEIKKEALEKQAVPFPTKESERNVATEKIETEKKKTYEKMIAVCGTKYKLITAVTFTENPHANESPYFVPLLKFTNENYDRIDLVAGDPAYVSRMNCTAVSKMGGIPRIYPKEGMTLKMRGSAAWTEMLLTLIKDPQKWLEEYHCRSISETVNSTFKRDFPVPLQKRLNVRRKQEAFLRVCNYDLKRLCYLKYLEDLDVKVGG
jgi:transposase